MRVGWKKSHHQDTKITKVHQEVQEIFLALLGDLGVLVVEVLIDIFRKGTIMDFSHSDKVRDLQQRVTAFMDEHVYPNEAKFFA